jgi:hypothetical protein
MVGFVGEWHEWIGHTYGPATYEAVRGALQGALARGGFETPRQALEALGEHLRG